MNYTLSAAAKTAGVAKSTISKALKEGGLSKVESVGNSYRIDPAELQRWIGVRAKHSEKPKPEQYRVPVDTPLETFQKDALQREIGQLQERLGDMKEQRDSWQKQAETNTRLLVDHSCTRGIIERIFGKSNKAA